MLDCQRATFLNPASMPSAGRVQTELRRQGRPAREHLASLGPPREHLLDSLPVALRRGRDSGDRDCSDQLARFAFAERQARNALLPATRRATASPKSSFRSASAGTSTALATRSRRVRSSRRTSATDIEQGPQHRVGRLHVGEALALARPATAGGSPANLAFRAKRSSRNLTSACALSKVSSRESTMRRRCLDSRWRRWTWP